MGKLGLEFRVMDVREIACVVKSVVRDVGEIIGINCFY